MHFYNLVLPLVVLVLASWLEAAYGEHCHALFSDYLPDILLKLTALQQDC
jgi:hypothetical protein